MEEGEGEGERGRGGNGHAKGQGAGVQAQMRLSAVSEMRLVPRDPSRCEHTNQFMVQPIYQFITNVF